MSGFKDIGLGMGGGSGSLAIGSFLPVPMPNGFLDTGGVSQVAGLGCLAISDTVDLNPWQEQKKTAPFLPSGGYNRLLSCLCHPHSDHSLSRDLYRFASSRITAHTGFPFD